MSQSQILQRPILQHDCGADLLIALAPHVGFAMVLYTVCDCNSYVPLYLVAFNVVACLIVGALAKRAMIFVSASLCLALVGWIAACTYVPLLPTQTVYSDTHSAIRQQAPIPQP